MMYPSINGCYPFIEGADDRRSILEEEIENLEI